jgi:predicted small metal-binding protein
MWSEPVRNGVDGWFFLQKNHPSTPFLTGSVVLSCDFRFWAGQEEEIERRYLQIARHIGETSTADVEDGKEYFAWMWLFFSSRKG